MSHTVENTPEAWEKGKLGLDESHVVVASQNISDQVDKGLGLKLISIRLPETLIDELKVIAEYQGIGYQPFIRKMLQRFATAELKQMAIDLYSKVKADAIMAEQDMTPPKPKRAARA